MGGVEPLKTGARAESLELWSVILSSPFGTPEKQPIMSSIPIIKYQLLAIMTLCRLSSSIF